MTMTLEDPPTGTEAGQSAAQRLRTTMAAIRLSFTWLGVRKALSTEQKSQAADAFGAEGRFLSAGKKLFDTSDSAYRAVTAIRNQATAYFRGVSLPFPEPGVRLIRQGDLEAIDERMAEYRGELATAVDVLDTRFDSLKAAARERLGRLYDPSDYPVTLRGLFEIAWDFPSVEPPAYLRQLSPELYRQECQRVQARFDEAVQLAEQAFLEELEKLVEHLADRLSGDSDGKPKVFRDSAVQNFGEFFERFRRLDIGSSEQFDELVERAQQVVGNVQPQQLRDSEKLRQRVVTQLAGVQSTLDGLLVDRPRRNILRKPKPR